MRLYLLDTRPSQKEPIITMRLFLRKRCPEVTRSLIILAAAYEEMQACRYARNISITLHFWHLHCKGANQQLARTVSACREPSANKLTLAQQSVKLLVA